MNRDHIARPIEILLALDSVEDETLTRIAMEECKLSNTVTVVQDGVEALSFLLRREPYSDANGPDLVILDMSMPRMNGIETLQQIRAYPQFSDLPIAIMTASPAENDILESYQLPTNCLIPKPLTSEQFIEIVKTVQHFGLAIYKSRETDL